MEVYNIAIKMGFSLNIGGLSSMTNAVFPAAMVEASYTGLFVFLFSHLWGNRAGAAYSLLISWTADGSLLHRTTCGCTPG